MADPRRLYNLLVLLERDAISDFIEGATVGLDPKAREDLLHFALDVANLRTKFRTQIQDDATAAVSEA